MEYDLLRGTGIMILLERIFLPLLAESAQRPPARKPRCLSRGRFAADMVFFGPSIPSGGCPHISNGYGKGVEEEVDDLVTLLKSQSFIG